MKRILYSNSFFYSRKTWWDLCNAEIRIHFEYLRILSWKLI